MTEACSSVAAVDTETTGLDWYARPFLVTGAYHDSSGGIQSRCWDLDSSDQRREAEDFLCSYDVLVFHNAKFDLQKLVLEGLLERSEITPVSIGDTEALAHLDNEHRSKRLKDLARDVLGLETDEAEIIKVEKRKLKLTKDDGYDKLPRELVIPYALKDAEFTLALYDYFLPRVSKFGELLALYHQELALTLALLDMEAKGLGVDVAYLEETAKDYAGRMLETELEIREITGIEDPKFPNSPKQILEWFNERGIELKATDRVALEGIDHPLGAKLLNLRKLRKIEGTYLRGLLKEQHEGIVHPWIRQHGTVTGRTASGGFQGD